MKKLLVLLFFVAGTSISLAQVEKLDSRQESDQDRIQQQPQLPAQVNMERNARIEAQRIQNEKDARKKAKKLAKARERVPTQDPIKK